MKQQKKWTNESNKKNSHAKSNLHPLKLQSLYAARNLRERSCMENEWIESIA